MKRISFAFMYLFIFLSMPVFGQVKLAKGTAVFAEWSSNNWYHGKIASTCADGYQVLFDDGDTKCCSLKEIALDKVPSAAEVKANTPVLAEWSNGSYYPGVIASFKGGKYKIDYDDGDTAVVSLSQLRIRTVAPLALADPPAKTEKATNNESDKPPEAASPLPKVVSQEMEIWYDGSSWAEIMTSGKIWIDGSRIGEIETNGKVWKDGSKVGEIEADGDIWIDGSKDARIEKDGDLWFNGSRVVEFESDGDIWYEGSKLWEVAPFDGGYEDMRVIAAILIFFAPEFAYDY